MTLNEFRELTKDLPGGLVLCVSKNKGQSYTADVVIEQRDRRHGKIIVPSLLIHERK